MSLSADFVQSHALSISSAAIPQANGQPLLIPLKLSGEEAINSLFEYRLVVQTPDFLDYSTASNFNLSDLVSREITCKIQIDGRGSYIPGLPGNAGSANQGAGIREISGIVEAAHFEGEENNHARYLLILRPWAYFMTLTADCKTFQDKSVIDVLDELLADYHFPVEKRLSEKYIRHAYINQWAETDWEFFSRLTQIHGINFHFAHENGAHRLILSDSNSAFQPFQKDNPDSAYHSIPFYQKKNKIDEEFIHAFAPVDRLTSGGFAARDYDYQKPKSSLDVKGGDPRATGQAKHEVYLWKTHKTAGLGSTLSGALASVDYSRPNTGMEKEASADDEKQGQWLARLRGQALRQQGSRAKGRGHVRGIVPGCTFELRRFYQQAANQEYIVLSTKFEIQNASHKRAETTNPMAVLSDAEFQATPGDWYFHVEFDVQPSKEMLRPEATQPKPIIYGPQTAVVMGPDDSTSANGIYTDNLGRCRIKFPWDRYGKSDHTASCWCRISSTWAGNQFGAMHLPRPGQEVIVNFMEGDPDAPIITGRVFNADNLPVWQLPGQQALSGFKSRELTDGGANSASGRSNAMIMDDTDGKIQLQLQSQHLYSYLSLGWINRVEGYTGRKEPRGQGFELRTDGIGAIRAKMGLFVTTYGRDQAKGHISDMPEVITNFTQARDQHETFADQAQKIKAQDDKDQMAVAKALKDINDALKGVRAADPQNGQFAELEQAIIAMASAAAFLITAKDSIHQHSGEHHAITSGEHTSISAGKSFLVYAQSAVKLCAYELGMKLVSYSADIEIQALKTSVNILAKLNITQTANVITLSAKEKVEIAGGGSSTTWEAGGITSKTSSAYTVHSAGFSLVGPAAGAKPALPGPPKPGVGQLNLLHQYIQQTLGVVGKYKVVDSLGKEVTGMLGKDGKTVVSGLAPGPVKVFFGKDPRNPWDKVNLIKNPPKWPPPSTHDDFEESAGGGAAAAGAGAAGLGSLAQGAAQASSLMAQAKQLQSLGQQIKGGGAGAATGALGALGAVSGLAGLSGAASNIAKNAAPSLPNPTGFAPDAST